MPTRRTFEMVVIVAVLIQPALAMVKLWTRKHIVVSGEGVTADAARVVTQIL